MTLGLYIADVLDEYSRENFRRIQRSFTDDPFDKGDFKFFEITFTGAVTNFKYPHNLRFMPKDVIQTSLKGAGALTWNYARFDSTNLDISTTGVCVVRAFVGSYEEG